jgi:uncharacterized membrane protein SpoIIM required for sporulation
MREALFIKRNAEKWTQYQQEPAEDPDEQAERFITLLDDLAYSKTFYPQSKVTRWINSISAGIYQNIYQNKKEKYTRLVTFWTTELPLVIRKYHRTLLFTLLFFVVFVAIGAFSSANDDGFVKTILGEDYVSMTEENISKGDPFGVYRDDNKFDMFVRIAVNNIRVSFLAYISGIIFWFILLPATTLRLLIFNGIMIGAFEHLFFSKGLGWKSILVIWIHGTLEIWSIVIAGAAGLIMGCSYVFPGTYSRMQSFKRGVKDSMKIILSLIPFFIAAAFLESFVTYQMSDNIKTGGKDGLPVWISILILASSLTFIIWYFWWYPIKVERKMKQLLPEQPVHLTLE